jgi:hypothetical protein
MAPPHSKSARVMSKGLTEDLRRRRNMEVHTIGMELGKPVFHVVDAHAR